MNNFIKHNKKFWSGFKPREGTEKILIEEPVSAVITHANAIFALILNQAKGYVPVWLYNKNCQNIKLLKSYNPNSATTVAPRQSLSLKIYIFLVSMIKFAKIYFTKDILRIYYDGIKYGDIIYDTYLIKNSVATIKKIDYKLFKYIVSCISRHIQIKSILQNGNYKAVLVSHQVGIRSGVMLRVALRYGYGGYLRTGHSQSTFQCFSELDEVYDHRFKPTPKEIDQIIDKLGGNLEKTFLETLEKEVAGKGSRDGINAFNKKNTLYNSRITFSKNYNLDQNKKNIFIMLHAFNDYPHSHFRWMIFKDYYDWFINTLEFAKTNNKVNWIFKQHPSIKYYPNKDTSFEKLFSECPDNIIYIDENNQIDTRSLVYCADLIVTCLGSAGFELPAMGAIPSLTAGDNFYTKLGFALEPTNKTEYFDILSRADKINKLDVEAQHRARAAYIYIYKISRVNITAYPELPPFKEKNKDINNWFWDKVITQYKTREDIILKEITKYISAIRKHNFKKLINAIDQIDGCEKYD